MSLFEDILLIAILGLLIFVARLQKRILKKMGEFDDAVTVLETETSETQGTVESAIVLLNGIKAQLDAALADDADDATRLARVQAVTTALGASTDNLAAAVAANAPPAPPTP